MVAATINAYAENAVSRIAAREEVKMFDEYEDMMSAEEVSEALRIGHNTVYSLLKSGELKAFRCGKNWKIPRAALERFVLEHSGLDRRNYDE